MPFERLDFLYTPSTDVAADLEYFERVLGAEVIFAIDDGGTRVAALRVAADGPLVLFTDHLGDQRPIAIYRVGDLDAAVDELTGRGWTPERALEIPHGPCRTFRAPGGHRLAIYELRRPEVAAHFEGRRDF